MTFFTVYHAGTSHGNPSALLKGLNTEVILIPGFMNLEMRMTSTLWYLCQRQEFILKNL